jgi:hypothetical protein
MLLQVRQGNDAAVSLQLMQPESGTCCFPAPIAADPAQCTPQPAFVSHAGSPAMQQQQHLLNVPAAVYMPGMMTHAGGMHGHMPHAGLQYVAGSQAALHSIMAAGNCSSSSSASSSSWAAIPDAVSMQQAHGTLPMSAMMSSHHLAAFPGYLPQQSAHMLQQPAFLQQQVHGQASPGQLPAYSSPAAVPLEVQLQQLSLGNAQIGGRPSSQTAGLPSTAPMHMMMMPQLTSAALAMPPATAAIAEHGMRLLLDQQQQQQQQLMPASAMQQQMLGHHGSSQHP